ncbi:T9SS type A sorting domain-containing protein [Chryseobacterium sp. Leaf180]|uniref:T9SS type A sorting domain-containing protein n=1 Tax=Chryseobacterium sp. Leaf180 TaxID=1736289 RepID=UPI001930F94E|nr:T9SS type A sorting domain-containing protein [Chryseobacterium sp. Leaf180]
MNLRLKSARNKLLEEVITNEDYLELKAESVKEIERLETQLAQKAYAKKIDFPKLLDEALAYGSNLHKVFINGDIREKRGIIGSIFPEKLVFSENQYRTTRTNVLLSYIYQINSEIEAEKNRKKSELSPLSGLVPITGDVYGSSSIGHTNFIYDESLNRYYLAGKRRNGDYGDMIDFSFNNIPIDKEAFLIAFNLNGNTVIEAWRKEINTGFATSILDDEIHSIIKDAFTSDIYIAGRYYSNTTTAATFGSYTFPIPTYGIQRPFIMKLNSAGVVQWAKIPDAIPAAVNGTAYRFMKGKIVQNGNEIGFAQGSWGISWGGFTMARPSGANADPVLFRFNKDTGSVLGMGEIYSNAGVQDEFTAIAVDNDGNYVLGGFFHQQLFTATDDNIPAMTLNVPGNRSQNFFTKYAKSACSQLSTSEITAENAQLSFYPNPAQDYVMISTKNKLQTFEVYSMTGQLVKRGKFESGENRINVQSLASGNYVIKITTDKSSLSGKIIKK